MILAAQTIAQELVVQQQFPFGEDDAAELEPESAKCRVVKEDEVVQIPVLQQLF
jgi:hypothetical protein